MAYLGPQSIYLACSPLLCSPPSVSFDSQRPLQILPDMGMTQRAESPDDDSQLASIHNHGKFCPWPAGKLSRGSPWPSSPCTLAQFFHPVDNITGNMRFSDPMPPPAPLLGHEFPSSCPGPVAALSYEWFSALVVAATGGWRRERAPRSPAHNSTCWDSQARLSRNIRHRIAGVYGVAKCTPRIASLPTLLPLAITVVPTNTRN